MMKWDIRTAGNMIGGRQGWAYVCNSGEVKVLKANMEAEQEYKDYATFGKARLVNKRGCGYVCKLAHSTEDGRNEWNFGNAGCFLSGSFTYNDAMELVENAGLVTISEGDVVAIAAHTSKDVVLMLYKLGSVDGHCTTAAKLNPLTEEEMAEVKRNAERWLNRR